MSAVCVLAAMIRSLAGYRLFPALEVQPAMQVAFLLNTNKARLK